MLNDFNSKAQKSENRLALAVIVDDLDRCSKEKAIEMLKATHLLLEQPEAPMAVFLAVDPDLIISGISESVDGVSNAVSNLCVPGANSYVNPGACVVRFSARLLTWTVLADVSLCSSRLCFLAAFLI